MTGLASQSGSRWVSLGLCILHVNLFPNYILIMYAPILILA